MATSTADFGGTSIVLHGAQFGSIFRDYQRIERQLFRFAMDGQFKPFRQERLQHEHSLLFGSAGRKLGDHVIAVCGQRLRSARERKHLEPVGFPNQTSDGDVGIRESSRVGCNGDVRGAHRGVRLYRCHLELGRVLAVRVRNTRAEDCETREPGQRRSSREAAVDGRLRTESSCHWTATLRGRLAIVWTVRGWGAGGGAGTAPLVARRGCGWAPSNGILLPLDGDLAWTVSDRVNGARMGRGGRGRLAGFFRGRALILSLGCTG